ncbi:MAG: MarR family transcriptional regulator [Paracoccaceae bacterium]|nr:MarR family transcriptional regulator [Paracoccaceae bacterium]MDG1970696.1 MarR family transcriptional regulator [Paracoccaceae bacterium]
MQAKLNAQASRLLTREAGISLTQWRMLLIIGSLKNARLSDIVRESALDKGQVSRTLKKMVADALVNREAIENDQRASGLTLTDKGQSLLTRILPLMTKRREHLTGSLAVIELDVLFDALDKLDISAEADEFP